MTDVKASLYGFFSFTPGPAGGGLAIIVVWRFATPAGLSHLRRHLDRAPELLLILASLSSISIPFLTRFTNTFSAPELALLEKTPHPLYPLPFWTDTVPTRRDHPVTGILVFRDHPLPHTPHYRGGLSISRRPPVTTTQRLGSRVRPVLRCAPGRAHRREEGPTWSCCKRRLLHDVCRATRAYASLSPEAGASAPAEILAAPPPGRGRAAIIAHIAFALAPPDTLKPASLFDADKLDAIGAIGWPAPTPWPALTGSACGLAYRRHTHNEPRKRGSPTSARRNTRRCTSICSSCHGWRSGCTPPPPNAWPPSATASWPPFSSNWTPRWPASARARSPRPRKQPPRGLTQSHFGANSAKL